MGHVWLARDEQTGLDVALKIVAREGKSGQRAEREARAAAALRHPRCQRIRSLARDPSNVYITYEYVPGRTLREAMRSGELDDRATLEVAAQICDALAHAHGRGIVHRDVKPSNVLLAETGDGRRPPARLRPRSDGGVRHAHRARRRARHARLHLARAAARRAGHTCGRRVGRRGPPLGGARRGTPLLARRPERDHAPDRARCPGARGAAPRPAAARARDGRRRPRARPAPPSVGRPPRSRAALPAESQADEGLAPGAAGDRPAGHLARPRAPGGRRGRSDRLGGLGPAVLPGRLAARPRRARRRRHPRRPAARARNDARGASTCRSRTSRRASQRSTPSWPWCGWH